MIISNNKTTEQLLEMGVASYWINLWRDNILSKSYWRLIDRRNDLYMYIRMSGADESRKLLKQLDEVLEEIRKHPLYPGDYIR